MSRQPATTVAFLIRASRVVERISARASSDNDRQRPIAAEGQDAGPCSDDGCAAQSAFEID